MLIIAPMIIPIKTNCIVQGGIRYCEDKNINKHHLGIMLLICLVVILWVGFWAWVAVEKNKESLAIVCGFILPMLIVGLVLLFI